ncbi:MULTISPECIES: IS3 family transposase [Geobacillus]|uniref:IS3 family transposase n=1 Tax=Geobacillus thermodenitrificans TaxID=33940 RepID=A0ABY9QCE4_GEOTD|nr:MULTISPECIES: IS3 family transposase [Geobacillus]PJW20011.1 hypothetical protein CV632_13260 [Geobacillus thermodenitrificans]WMV76233.1 IS3 family transposase [Geobacillus thermodenitrificans]
MDTTSGPNDRNTLLESNGKASIGRKTSRNVIKSSKAHLWGSGSPSLAQTEIQLSVNHKRVQRLMREMGIRAVIQKKRPYYGKKASDAISGNHLNRNFHATNPNEKWVTDITYLIFNGQTEGQDVQERKLFWTMPAWKAFFAISRRMVSICARFAQPKR